MFRSSTSRRSIQLKLAARRHQDFADVVNLIHFNNLDESFADGLHPSVRRDYIECLEEKRRDDEYEARKVDHESATTCLPKRPTNTSIPSP